LLSYTGVRRTLNQPLHRLRSRAELKKELPQNVHEPTLFVNLVHEHIHREVEKGKYTIPYIRYEIHVQNGGHRGRKLCILMLISFDIITPSIKYYVYCFSKSNNRGEASRNIAKDTRLHKSNQEYYYRKTSF